MELKLILKDNTEIVLADGNFIQKFTTICNNKQEIDYLWNKMSSENLSDVRITLGDELIQTIKDIIIDGMQIAYNSNGTFTVHFYFYGATYGNERQKEYIQAAKILLGEEQ